MACMWGVAGVRREIAFTDPHIQALGEGAQEAYGSAQNETEIFCCLRGHLNPRCATCLNAYRAVKEGAPDEVQNEELLQQGLLALEDLAGGNGPEDDESASAEVNQHFIHLGVCLLCTQSLNGYLSINMLHCTAAGPGDCTCPSPKHSLPIYNESRFTTTREFDFSACCYHRVSAGDYTW